MKAGSKRFSAMEIMDMPPIHGKLKDLLFKITLG
jgi:hypothetical protein